MNDTQLILGTNQDPFFKGGTGFPEAEDTVRLIADAGLGLFELCPEYLHQGPDKLTVERRRGLCKVAETAGVHIIIHASYCSLNFCFLNEHTRRESIEQFKREIELASDVESRFITIHPGPPFGIAEWYDKEMFEKMILDGYAELIRYAWPLGVTVCTENIPFPHLFSTEFMGSILAALDAENFGLTFDLGHHNLMYHDLSQDERTESMAEVLRRFSNRIKILHIHDNKGTGDDHEALGTGEIEFETVLGEARKNCPDALWSMELQQYDAVGQSIEYLSRMENVIWC